MPGCEPVGRHAARELAKNEALSPAGTLTAPAGGEEGPVSKDALPHTATGGEDGAEVPTRVRS